MATKSSTGGATVKPPSSSELGSLLPGVLPASAGAFWSSLLDEGEYVPKLRWPMSRPVYDEMSRDGQIQAIWNAYTLPIRSMRWQLRPNGAREEVVSAIAEDLGIPVEGAPDGPVKRGARKFNFDEFLSHALLALRYGFTFFEIVGEYRDSNLSMWRLRKLAPRIPTTIDSIKVADDGGLKSVVQSSGVEIPVSQLVAFTWQREGANYYGQSIFRGAYKYWALKDRLIRIDAISKDRNGMGVPWAKATDRDVDQGTVNQAFRAASASRVGQRSGGALPFGVDIEYKGVTGSVPNTLDSIKYMDEQMTRSTLTQFLMLGQTQTGSYNLGESFVDFFSLAINAVCKWFCQVVNSHVIDDWVEFNYGSEEEYAPELVFERQQTAETDLTQLINLMDKGAITADKALEDYLRAQVGVPAKEDDKEGAKSYQYDLELQVLTIDERRAQIGLEPLPDGAGQKFPESPQTQSLQPTTTVEARGLRRALARERKDRASAATEGEDGYEGRLIRDPRPEEKDTPIEAMDTAWTDAKDEMVRLWLEAQDGMSEEILEQVREAAGDINKLAELSATVPDLQPFVDQLLDLLEAGVNSAIDEAYNQGVELSDPNIEDIAAGLTERINALAVVMVADYASGAAKQAMRLTNGATSDSVDDVILGVQAYLEGLSTDYVDRQFSDLSSTTLGAGRQAVFEEAEEEDDEALYYHSTSILDGNTCPACAKEDGKNFATLAEALIDFPTGKYKDCAGRERCRCFLVARYEEFPAAK